MIIILDQHISIKNTIAAVFPEVTHSLCDFHMKNNVNNTYKNPNVTTLYLNAFRVYCIDEFRKLMGELNIVKPKVFNKLIKDDVHK